MSARASVYIVIFDWQFIRYEANTLRAYAKLMLSSMYEHFPRSDVEKYLDVVDTKSNCPFLTLNRHPEAATLEASVVRTSSSDGSGIVNLRFSAANALAVCHARSSISVHLNSFFFSRKLSG